MKGLIALAVVIATMVAAGPAFGDTFITDTLAPGGGTSQTPGYRFITDTLAPGGGSASLTAAPSTGFSWSDAGVGAGAAVGGMLALIGSSLIVVRRHGRLAV